MVIHHRPSAIDHFRLRCFNDPAALDAVGARLDFAMDAIYDGVDHLEVWLEQARRDRCHVLADTALFLGLTATENGVSARVALAANFTTSRHGFLLLRSFYRADPRLPSTVVATGAVTLQFIREGRTIVKETQLRKGKFAVRQQP